MEFAFTSICMRTRFYQEDFVPLIFSYYYVVLVLVFFMDYNGKDYTPEFIYEIPGNTKRLSGSCPEMSGLEKRSIVTAEE